MDKIVVITGGSKGIGNSCCKEFHAMGYSVFELSRTQISSDFATHITCDVTNIESVEKAFSTLNNLVDHVDILINNAGFGISGPIEDTSTDKIKSQFDVNLFGAITVTNKALPLLKKACGKVVFISSVAGILSIPFQTAYSASKAALNSYSLGLRNELRPLGVKVQTIMLGDCQSSFTDNREKICSPQYMERFSRSIAVMENDERKGMPTSKTAKNIYRIATKSNKPLVTVGFKYKFFALLNRILPTSLINKILYSLYAK